jgi:hypothetical protein
MVRGQRREGLPVDAQSKRGFNAQGMNETKRRAFAKRKAKWKLALWLFVLTAGSIIFLATVFAVAFLIAFAVRVALPPDRQPAPTGQNADPFIFGATPPHSLQNAPQRADLWDATKTQKPRETPWGDPLGAWRGGKESFIEAPKGVVSAQGIPLSRSPGLIPVMSKG